MRSPVARRRRRRFWNRTQSFHKNNARPSQKHHSCVALWGQRSRTSNEYSRQRIFGSERTTTNRHIAFVLCCHSSLSVRARLRKGGNGNIRIESLLSMSDRVTPNVTQVCPHSR